MKLTRRIFQATAFATMLAGTAAYAETELTVYSAVEALEQLDGFGEKILGQQWARERLHRFGSRHEPELIVQRPASSLLVSARCGRYTDAPQEVGRSMMKSHSAAAGRRWHARLLGAWLAGGVLAAASLPAAQPVLPSAQEVETAVAAVYPALVNISAVSRDFAEGRAMRFPSGCRSSAHK